MKRNDFDHGDMVANIMLYRASATLEQAEAGADWYPSAGRIVEQLAEATDTEPYRFALALAALSPRNPWRWNVADAYSFAVARRQGMLMPSATTFRRNQLAAWRALGQDAGQTWATTAPKVKAFVAAIMGDLSSVVIDTWAVRVATGGAKSEVRGDKAYLKVASAYMEAAGMLNEAPAVTQAITWLVAQTEGLASGRKGRHDLAYKTGTPAIVISVLKGEPK